MNDARIKELWAKQDELEDNISQLRDDWMTPQGFMLDNHSDVKKGIKHIEKKLEPILAELKELC